MSGVLDSGWVADNTTWTNGLTGITPAKQFKGDVAKSSWLLNEDIAFIYRACATFDWPLKITSPGPTSAKSKVFDSGSAVTIKVDDSKFAGWQRQHSTVQPGARRRAEVKRRRGTFGPWP